ncbi:Serine/threonine-protein kinase StkP [Dolichospermum sp. UHCC 0315A]|uniref:serine/threonine-protein kinase n=1 Tax=Dolichospermum sp. UHCC 0315A TaxID=1914871 RepID=UPI001252253B|nr:serine/threonine-protein kinase [Dolichospermum sp. UHCC 0315A]QEI42535.1 Serine/threonine-protein kinase StkP [Dolichospermum sp. UHCC 0315A]
MAWLSGQELQNGKYTIEKELGEGGFGITYRARDNQGNFVVIKTLNDAIQKRADFAKFQQDFLNEAIKLAKCSHPHIVQIYEVIHENDLWCMVMEYIDGEDLGTIVENQGILSETEALRYIQQIGSALTVVHDNGLLHRDIKPQNIMLRSGKSEAVLIDFGIAREFSQNLTQTHTQMLADGFAPIEQYDKKAKRGAFTDVYALAATLYSVLTGELPTISPMRAIGTELEEAKKINSSISDKVNQAIIKGMEIKPENRPQSISEWLSLLNIQKTSNNTILSATQIIEDKIIHEFKTHVDYKSSTAGLLIHHKESSSDLALHYHITISDTHAFNFGGNGFAVFRIPRKYHIVESVTLLPKKEVVDRCLIAYELFKTWDYGLLGWNCEHFARLVTTGEAISYQVKESILAFLNNNGYHPLAKEMMDKAYQTAKY